MNYYNEIDPYCAAWLRNLIAAGHIAPGDVDDRSITEVSANDVRGYTQCHFFAGIGGWSLAARLAGWPDDRPMWTGSCPCQPFSAAGKGGGFADERHLWPAWFRLIRECRPDRVFGEQVASALPWIDLVSGDLEGEGYTFGAAIVGAHSVGAPHIRQRLYWMGDADSATSERRTGSVLRTQTPIDRAGFLNGSKPIRLADASESMGRMADSNGAGSFPAALPDIHSRETRTGVRNGKPERSCAASRMADSNGRNASTERQQRGGKQRQQPQNGGAVRGGPANGPWADADWLGCTDGKWRSVEPGLEPLAHGIPGRVGRLRAYGNAIVPLQAAEFIAAFMSAAADACR